MPDSQDNRYKMSISLGILVVTRVSFVAVGWGGMSI